MQPPKSPALRILSASVKAKQARLTAAVLLALVSAAVGVVSPLLISRLITALGRHTSLTGTVIELAAAAFAGAFAGGWSSYLLSVVGEGAVADVRMALARHAARLSLEATRRLGTGEIVSRLVADAAQLRSFTDTGVTALPVSAVMVAAYLTVMGILDWTLLLVTLGTFAVASIAIRAFLVRMRRGAQEQQAALGRLAQGAQSVFAAASTVKAYRAEERAVRPLGRQATAAAAAAVRTARSQAAIAPLMGLGQQAAIIGVLAVGGAQLASGSLTIAHFMAFLMYLFQLVNPLMTLAQGAGRIQVGTAAAARLDQVLAVPQEQLEAGQAPAADPDAPVVRLTDVDVVLAGKPVLRSLSFEVPRTGVVAVVGLSGAGKSTLLNVLERFVEPVGGTVQLLGTDLRDWPLAAARGRLALVEQGGSLLAASVRDNLSLGCEEPVPEEELWSALRTVGLDETAKALPDGLDTVLGAGVQLSGGEVQRLAIARALLTDAEILLMDEPSAHLDGENDTRLVELLQRLGRDRAVILITHRTSTSAAAGSVAVMSEGRIVAVGDHQSLLADCIPYQALVHGQDAAAGEGFGAPARPVPAAVGVGGGVGREARA